VTPLENTALTIVSTDWRLFNIRQASAAPKSHVKVSIEPAEPRAPLDGPPGNSNTKGQGSDRGAVRYHLVIELDRTSRGFRLARKLYQGLSAERLARSVSPAAGGHGASVRLAFLSVEHTFAGLKIKVPIFRLLAATFERAART
jgi:hypothetical protein